LLSLIHSQENRYHSYLLATELRRSSDELTRLVRTYASTGNPLFFQQYWQVLAIRNGKSLRPVNYDRVYWDFLTIKGSTPAYPLNKAVSLHSLMKDAGFSEDEFLLLEESQRNSDQLVNLERIAMNAIKGQYLDAKGNFSIIAKPDKKIAVDMLYSEKYHKAKMSIMKPINQFYEKLDQRTKIQVQSSSHQLKSTLNIQLTIFILSVAAIILLMFKVNNNHKKIIKILNQQVDEKTEKLSGTNIELHKVLSEMKTLTGIIPICSYCKSIRNDKGAWDKLESYISKHSDARFSHGVCPKCLISARKNAGLEES